MVKQIKRLLALLMAALMCLTVQLPSFAAEEDGYFYDFNTDNPDEYFATVSGWNTSTTKSSFSIHSWEDGTEDAVWGQSVKCINGSSNEQAILTTGGAYDMYAAEFSFRRDSASSTMHLDYYYTKDVYVVKFNTNNQVQLFDTVVTTYELETWYDVKCWFIASQNYARLWFKESSSDTWNVYDGFLNSTPVSTGTSRVNFEFFTGTQNDGGVTYLDNIKIYPITDNFEPSLSSYSDDFEDGVYYDSSVSDYTKYWKAINTNSQTEIVAEPLDGYDGNVLKLKDISSSTSAVNLTVGKYPFAATTTPDVRHKISFKIGSNFDSGNAGVWMKFRDPQSGNLSEVTLLDVHEGKIIMGDASGGVTFENAGVEPGKLYDVEFIYDAKASAAILSVTGENGDIYSSFLDMGLFGGGYGLINNIEFANHSTAQNEVYIDDFNWDIHRVEFAPVGYALKSGYTDGADINETVVFDYTDIIAEDVTPSVTITKDGAVIDTAYTLEAKGNTVQIAFEELEKASDYTVELSGVTGAFSAEPVKVTAEFTTSDYTVETESLSISDGTVTAQLKGAYADGFTAYIAAAAYDADGSLTEVKLLPVEVPYRTADVVTFTPSFDGAYSFFKAMIIRDFSSAISYSGSVSSN